MQTAAPRTTTAEIERILAESEARLARIAALFARIDARREVPREQ